MLKTIDLFSGAGGLSLGFQQTGEFQIIAAAEINKAARETYKANIASNVTNFVFINDIKGYDFSTLSGQVGGIDIVIGGPPCQGFSNANRQKNHVINMNNSLVKEYFRAIKELKPIAFVMENVSMLESDKHRFYESYTDNTIIDELISNGFNIPKKEDSIFIAPQIIYNSIDLMQLINNNDSVNRYLLPEPLYKLLNTLSKHYSNEKRLNSFLQKQTKFLIKNIKSYVSTVQDIHDEYHTMITSKLMELTESFNPDTIINIKNDVSNIVSLQKALLSVEEIHQNKLIGKYNYIDGTISFITKSFSVIDYINAILGNDYIQCGGTLNAKWFGVHQYRRRHVIVGIRRDKYKGGPLLPQKAENVPIYSVWDAIKDLATYESSYDKDAPAIAYKKDDNISLYGKLMRQGNSSFYNHLTTKTTETAMTRFKAIKPGKNFHSLSTELKSTYTNPERTQNTIYLRLNPDEPSGTVVNVRKSMWIHPTLDRAITVREAARLQSFPDSFIFCGTKDSQFQQVGNAVPPLLAKAIATNLLNRL